MNVGKVPMMPYLAAVIPALAAGAIKDKTFPLKRVFAAFLYGAIIWGLAEWRLDVATAFAWVGALTSLIINGSVFITAITRGF